MRGPAAALAFGLGLGLPCLLAVGTAAFGWDVPGQVYGTLAGVGFSTGLIVAAVVDGLMQRAERMAELRRSHAQIDATEAATAAQWAKLEGSVVEPEPAVDLAAERQYKKDKLEIIFRAGSAGNPPGFSYDKMDGVVGSTTLGKLHDFYCSDAGRRAWRVESGNVGTVWGHGWGLDFAMREMLADRLPLPPFPLPDIGFYIPDTAGQKAARKGKTKVAAGVGGG